MNEAELFAMLRLADSAFPGGGFAFSSGLEGAYLDGLVTGESDVSAFIVEQLRLRWQHSDRVILRLAWPSHTAAAEVDALAESTILMSTLRSASKRAGLALLGTFSELAVPEAAQYRAAVVRGELHGHLPVAQARCYRGVGLSLGFAECLSAWQLVSGMASAALRLGIVGHLGAQRILIDLAPALAAVTAQDPGREIHGFSTFADIASQRGGRPVRMFTN